MIGKKGHCIHVNVAYRAQGAAWIIGGMSAPGYGVRNDAWFESSNGAACTAAEPGDSCARADGSSPLIWGRAGREPFSPRAFAAAVSLNGSLWLAGGAARSANYSIAPCAAARADFDCFLDTSLPDGLFM